MKGWVGIDIAKDTFTVTYLAADQEQERVQGPQTYSLTQQGWQRFRHDLDAFASDVEQVAIALESSGPYTRLPLAHLLELPYPVYLLNPTLVRRFRQSLSLRPVKTDNIDASAIARFLRHMHPRLTPVSPSPELHLLTREYETISQHIAQLKTRIKQQIHILFPELPRHVSLFSQTILRLLLAFPSASAIAQADPAHVETLLTSSRGRKLPLSPHDLQALARSSLGIDLPVHTTLLQSLIRRLLALLEEQQHLRQAIEDHFRDQEAFHHLAAIPGMGLITTATLLAEIQNVTRFPTAKHLVAYAGLDPSLHQSGRYQGASRLSKRGNPHLRRILFLLARTLIRTTQRFAQAYHHHRQKGRSHREALVIVSRKILVVFYTLLKRNIPFQDLPPSTTPLPTPTNSC